MLRKLMQEMGQAGMKNLADVEAGRGHQFAADFSRICRLLYFGAAFAGRGTL